MKLQEEKQWLITRLTKKERREAETVRMIVKKLLGKEEDEWTMASEERQEGKGRKASNVG